MAFILDDSNSASTNGSTDTIRIAADHLKHAQKFVPSVTAKITRATLKLAKVGSPTGNIWIEVYSDNAGLPDTLLGNISALVDVSTISSSATDINFDWSDGPLLTNGTSYWLVINADYTISAVNFIRDYVRTPLYRDESKVWNGSAWNDRLTDYSLYFLEYREAVSSASPSVSPSVSPSASVSPSVSPSSSVSASVSPSASISPSSSSSRSVSSTPSPSISPSPSEGYSLYSRGNESILPVNTDNLNTLYTEAEEIIVSTSDSIYIDQTGSNTYLLHQFKAFVGNESFCTLYWKGKSELAPSTSLIALQIFNVTSNVWETIDSNNSGQADVDIELQDTIVDLTNYKDANSVISCRVYQLAN